MKLQNIYTMKQPELGIKISELRKAKGLTQEELVEKCNISVRTIQRIEAGEVTPRSYTIKSILDVLEYDFSSIIKAESTKHHSKFLKLAWIFGIVYFVVGFFEFAAEYYRLEEEEMIYSKLVYIIIKIVVLISFSLFMYGFFAMSDLFKNYILKIASLLLLCTFFLAISYDILSLYYSILPLEIILIIQLISFGVVQLIFGIGLLKSIKDLGNLALIAGILEILTGALLITVSLSYAGLIVYIPTIVFEIILLYKASELIRPSALN